MVANNDSIAAERIHKDRIVLAGAGLVFAVLVVSGWLLFDGGDAGDTRSTGYTHMHCSVCGDEVPYLARLAGSKCPVCESGGTYTPTVGSVMDGASAPSAGSKWLLFALVAVVSLQGLAYLAIVRFKVLSKAAAEARNRPLICRCPYCARKIGFPAAKAGSGGLCPRCKTAFVFRSMEDPVEN